MTLPETLAYARLNDHRLPGEISTAGPLTRGCLKVLREAVERLEGENETLRRELGKQTKER